MDPDLGLRCLSKRPLKYFSRFITFVVISALRVDFLLVFCGWFSAIKVHCIIKYLRH